MNIPKQPAIHLLRLSALVLVTAWAVSGCSGSGESVTSKPVAGDSQASVDSMPPTTPGTATGSNVDDNEETGVVSGDAPGVDEDESTDVEAVDDSGSSPNDPVSNNPVVEDPLIQNTIPVSFEITVPVYQSNALRVELDWGDMSFTASWVGDELWAASAEFPTDTENSLRVTFFDLNGDLELAGFTQDFRTGFNVAAAFQISADQFNDSQFDTDGDGVSNLSEMIAGTDPLVDEDSLLRIVDKFYSNESALSVSWHFESQLSEARPLSIDTLDSNPGEAVTTSVNAQIDAQGNGPLMYYLQDGSSSLRLDGVRTHSESSIIWEGTRTSFESGHARSADFTNTVTVVDASTRVLVEEVEGSNIGDYHTTWETSSNLTGKLVEGSASLCSPVAGIVTTHLQTNRPGSLPNTTITVSKELDDQYWRVITATEEYFARELVIFSSNSQTFTTGVPEDAFFICDFVDI